MEPSGSSQPREVGNERCLTKKWTDFFVPDNSENESQCTLCRAILSKKSISNLKRHFVSKHVSVATELKVTIKKRKRKVFPL